MVLLLLLRRLHGRSCIVFTGSVESTHRLTRLLQLMGGCSGSETDGAVVEFSAMLPQRRRDKIVKQVRMMPACAYCVGCDCASALSCFAWTTVVALWRCKYRSFL
jgi:superfamily II DNA/RNA helicase